MAVLLGLSALVGVLFLGACGSREAAEPRSQQSPEGSIAFLASSDAGLELNIWDLQQGTTQALPGHHQPRSLSWAPGGEALAVSTTEGIGKLDIGSGEWELLVPRDPHFLPLESDWSPDGRWIAFTAERDAPNLPALFLASSDSGRYQAIPGTQGGWSPSFSPDGSRLAFAQEILEGGLPTYKVMVINLDGSDPRPVAEAMGFWNVVNPRYVAWSPDGSKIAFEDTRPDPNQLMLVDVTSGEVEAIGPWATPSWAPDGTHLVVEGLVPEGSSQLFVINTKGERIEPLPAGINPDWGP